MVNTSGRGFLSNCLTTFQVLIKAGSDLSSACRTPYGNRRTEAFSFLIPQKDCVLSQPNIFYCCFVNLFHNLPDLCSISSWNNTQFKLRLKRGYLALKICSKFVSNHSYCNQSRKSQHAYCRKGEHPWALQLEHLVCLFCPVATRVGWCLETLPRWKFQGAALFGLCTVLSFIYVLCAFSCCCH